MCVCVCVCVCIVNIVRGASKLIEMINKCDCCFPDFSTHTEEDCGGIDGNGVHKIKPQGLEDAVEVYCEYGHTYIMHRFNGTE